MTEVETDKEVLKILREDYFTHASVAGRLRQCLVDQLTSILTREEITLGVPMEHRVKSWASIEEKIQRKSLALDSVLDLDDFIGVRLILLFLDDVEKLDEIIRSELDVIKFENASTRLGMSQFGYQSNHYLVRIPEAWLKVPNYSDLGHLRAEIQVRTLAQHIWAANSHKLQYKREEGVPPPIRRTIHRVSALLETVDLEFSRVLAERTEYVAQETSPSDAEELNVDLISKILREVFPAENESGWEDYDSFLEDCHKIGITKSDELIKILKRNRSKALEEDQKIVEDVDNLGVSTERTLERVSRGVYFGFTGLAREAIRQELGDAVTDIFTVEDDEEAATLQE